MQAQQGNQPNQEAAQMPANQKAFADLLFTMMDVIEKYQEGENGEGNYLTAMNSLRDLHKFKEQLRTGGGGVVFQYYEAVHRAPAPLPVRQQAPRRKLTEEQKRENGYVCCVKCGRLFSDNSKLKRHQDTTEICRHIIHEKEVAVQTKQVQRTKGPELHGRAGRKQATKAIVSPPDDHCLTKKHPFYGSFVHSLMLFVEGRKAELKQIWTTNYHSWDAEFKRKLQQEREEMLALPPLFCGERVLNKDKIKRETQKMNFYDAYSHTITIDGYAKIFTTAAAELEPWVITKLFVKQIKSIGNGIGAKLLIEARKKHARCVSPTPSLLAEQAMELDEIAHEGIHTPDFSAPTSPDLEYEDDTEEMALLMKYAGAVESCEDQDDFTNRMCGNCDKEFDLSDPHHYDEEIGECYCSEKCLKEGRKAVESEGIEC
jgi:hypothetical protein